MQIISTFDFSLSVRVYNADTEYGLMRKSREANTHTKMFTIISMAELHGHECMLHVKNMCMQLMMPGRGCISAPGTFVKLSEERYVICKFSRKYSFSCRFTNKIETKRRRRRKKKSIICAIFFFVVFCAAAAVALCHSFNSRTRHLLWRRPRRRRWQSQVPSASLCPERKYVFMCTIVLR